MLRNWRSKFRGDAFSRSLWATHRIAKEADNSGRFQRLKIKAGVFRALAQQFPVVAASLSLLRPLLFSIALKRRICNEAAKRMSGQFQSFLDGMNIIRGDFILREVVDIGRRQRSQNVAGFPNVRLAIFSVIIEEGVSSQASQSANRIHHLALHTGQGQPCPHAARRFAKVKDGARGPASGVAVESRTMIKKRNPTGHPLPDGWLGVSKDPDLPDAVIARVGIVQSVLKDCQQRQLPACADKRGDLRQWFKKCNQFRAGFKGQKLDAQGRVSRRSHYFDRVRSPNRSAR